MLSYNKKLKKHRIGLVGATGLVGQELLSSLQESDLAIDNLSLFASSKSRGKEYEFREKKIVVEELKKDALKNFDFLFFCSEKEISQEFAPFAAENGSIVIDNSSAFRMSEEVPLIIPEINPQALEMRKSNLIANPNCTTIITLMGLFPLHEKYRLKQILASTYQAVSGSGKMGIEALEREVKGEDSKNSPYRKPIAFNVIPQIGNIQSSGYTEEEEKLLKETRKILNLPELRVSCTCVRVPVWECHSISVEATFEETPPLESLEEIYQSYSGVEVVPIKEADNFPTPRELKKDSCIVGRVRKSSALEKTLSLWIVGNQIRKGAALNAVQIAETIGRN